ncbi:MAG: peptide chain release factor N(5)-glutamine methyltransferase [Pseudoflavonifractor sp.]|nr:peptide chain release factor N(5)-glutamine methyltransferase [Alloprevotella sp.]MCM1115947.1 peptide chain release factor N(5)-glutamine methyltransferase [Pseudoflavonifractor sp.]
MKLSQLIRHSVATLSPLVGEREARASVGLIFEALKGWSAVDLVIRGDDEASPFITAKVNDTIHRMLSHEPVQYILGQALWHGMKLRVNPSVLIPRPETSELVDIIVKQWEGKKDLRLADICTGSGCIAIALARALPFSIVTAVDNSPEALDVARQNGDELRVARSISWVEADALNPSTLPAGPYDFIVANPPYIAEDERGGMDRNVLMYEPHAALFVPDSDPLIFYRAISSYALSQLRPGGMIYFETNPLYASRLASHMEQAGWIDVDTIRDIHAAERFLSARKSS